MKKQLTITIDADGDIKIDASKQPGTEQQILDELKELAEFVGGDIAALQIEKHVHSHGHGHEHHDDHQHAHG